MEQHVSDHEAIRFSSENLAPDDYRCFPRIEKWPLLLCLSCAKLLVCMKYCSERRRRMRASSALCWRGVRRLSPFDCSELHLTEDCFGSRRKFRCNFTEEAADQYESC